jgi:hypothetical protein
MVSIIICSRNADISSALKANIKSTIGVDYEIIIVDNSHNNYSIFSAYNYGLSISNFPYLCFIHEDVLFDILDWGCKLISHLSDYTCGIIGVAGGKIITNVPAQWSNEKSYLNIIQHSKRNSTQSYLKEPNDFSGLRQPAIVVDGVFLSMRRDLFQQIRFDEELEGFHAYDYDISIQSVVAGFTNYVVYDILLEHYSQGHKDVRYYTNLIKVYKKWDKHLPLFSHDSIRKTTNELQLIEKKRLQKLIRRMAKTGFTMSEIVSNSNYFIESLKLRGISIEIKYIRITVFFIRLLNPFWNK